MNAPIQFPFLPRPNGNGPLDIVPLLPVRLTQSGVSVDVLGLVDTGASFNVLPYDVGIQFGIAWNSLPQSITLSGAHGPAQAKILALDAVIGLFAPVALVFAWASSNDYPVFLGQANFLFNFDVCLFRRQSLFQIQPAKP
jgi:hypothetical protein